MKKIVTLLLSLCLLYSSALTCYGATSSLIPESTPVEDDSTTIEYLEDGSYFITVIKNASSPVSVLSNTVTKSKTATYYGESSSAKWSVTVTGTFTYGNGTSKCTSSSASAESYNTATWRIADKYSSYSGNTATATAIAKQYQSNQLLQAVTKKVTLTCSATGEFS